MHISKLGECSSLRGDFYLEGNIIYFCLAQKCNLPRQLSTKNNLCKTNLGFDANETLCCTEQCTVHFLSDSVTEVKVKGWVLKPVSGPGHCLERQVGRPLLGLKAVSLLEQVVAEGSPEDHGLEVVIGDQG